MATTKRKRGRPTVDERHPVDVLIGQRLRARRIEIGMSQEALGALIGVTFQQVQKYEKGVNRIGGSRLHAIGEALRTPVGYFFETSAPLNGLQADRSTLEFAKRFQQFPAKHHALLRHFMSAFAEAS